MAETADIIKNLMLYARALGLDPATAVAQAAQESGFDASQVGSLGELGILQVKPDTGAEVGARFGLSPEEIRLDDPQTGAYLGLNYLKQLVERRRAQGVEEGDALAMALSDYNAGPYQTKRPARRQGDAYAGQVGALAREVRGHPEGLDAGALAMGERYDAERARSGGGAPRPSGDIAKDALGDQDTTNKFKAGILKKKEAGKDPRGALEEMLHEQGLDPQVIDAALSRFDALSTGAEPNPYQAEFTQIDDQIKALTGQISGSIEASSSRQLPRPEDYAPAPLKGKERFKQQTVPRIAEAMQILAAGMNKYNPVGGAEGWAHAQGMVGNVAAGQKAEREKLRDERYGTALKQAELEEQGAASQRQFDISRLGQLQAERGAYMEAGLARQEGDRQWQRDITRDALDQGFELQKAMDDREHDERMQARQEMLAAVQYGTTERSKLRTVNQNILGEISDIVSRERSRIVEEMGKVRGMAAEAREGDDRERYDALMVEFQNLQDSLNAYSSQDIMRISQVDTQIARLVDEYSINSEEIERLTLESQRLMAELGHGGVLLRTTGATERMLESLTRGSAGVPGGAPPPAPPPPFDDAGTDRTFRTDQRAWAQQHTQRAMKQSQEKTMGKYLTAIRSLSKSHANGAQIVQQVEQMAAGDRQAYAALQSKFGGRTAEQIARNTFEWLRSNLPQKGGVRPPDWQRKPTQ